METLGIRIKLVALVAVAAAVLVAGSLAAPRQAHANIADPTGVMCFELTSPVTAIGLVRIDIDGSLPDISFSANVYVDGGSGVPDCQNPQDSIPDDATPFPARTASRAVFPGTWTSTGPGGNITASVCQFELDFGGIPLTGWTRIDVDFDVVKVGKASGTFTFHPNVSAPTGDPVTTCGLTGDAPVNITVAGVKYFDGPGGSPATFTSDWDKDGATDWDELEPGLPGCSDPFKAENCEDVGGVAELSDVAGTPLETGDSSSNIILVAAIAAAAVIGATVLGGAALYAARRRP